SDDARDVRAMTFAVVAEIAGILSGHRVEAALDREIRFRGNAGVDDADGDALACRERRVAVEVPQTVVESEADRHELDRRAGAQRDAEPERVPEALRRVDVEPLDLLRRRAELQSDLTLCVRRPARAQ